MLPVSEDTVLLGVINPQLSILTFHLKERPTLSDNDNAPAAHPSASPLSRSFPANSSESFFALSLSTIAMISSLLSQNQKQNNSLCHPPHFIAYSNGKPQLPIFSVYKFTAWLSESITKSKETSVPLLGLPNRQQDPVPPTVRALLQHLSLAVLYVLALSAFICQYDFKVMMGTQLTGVFLHIACGSPAFATCLLSLNLGTGFLSFIHSHGSTVRCRTCAFDLIMPLLRSKPSPLGYAAQSLVGFSKHRPSSWLAFDYEFNDSLRNTK